MKIKKILSAFTALILIVCSVVSISAVEPNSANLKVIDVSQWQGDINWRVTAGVIDGVIVRIGYRGSQYRNNIVEDPKFKENIEGITANNVHFGVYFYSYAYTEAEAAEEANWVINTLKKYNCKPDFPVYIDVEEPEAQTLLTTRERTDVVHSFVKTMQAAGYYAGVYANKYWMTELLYSSEFSDYPIWLAQYNSTCTYEGKYDMWQYSNKGSVSGINGNVDMSKCYRDYPTFIKEYGYNGFTGNETPPAGGKYYSYKAIPRQAADGMTVVGGELLTESGFMSEYISLASGVSYKMTAASGKYIGTGSEISFISGGNSVEKLIIVVSGDCNGDGVCDGIDLADALNISSGSACKITYTAAQKKAADINLDGKVDSSDINAIKKSAFGTADLPK